MNFTGTSMPERVKPTFNASPTGGEQGAPTKWEKRIPQGPGRATWRGVCGRFPYGMVAPYFMMRIARDLTPANWEFFWVLCSLIRIDNEAAVRVAGLAKATGLSKTMIYRRFKHLSNAGLVLKDPDTLAWMINPSVFLKGRVEYQHVHLNRWLEMGGRNTWEDGTVKNESKFDPSNKLDSTVY